MMDQVPYVSLVGRLIFAMVCTRPDFAFQVGVLNRFNLQRNIDDVATEGEYERR